MLRDYFAYLFRTSTEFVSRIFLAFLDVCSVDLKVIFTIYIAVLLVGVL